MNYLIVTRLGHHFNIEATSYSKAAQLFQAHYHLPDSDIRCMIKMPLEGSHAVAVNSCADKLIAIGKKYAETGV